MIMSKREKVRPSREERLREALRENLKRRRAQARGREQVHQKDDKHLKTRNEDQS
jgi:hypothetical protein